MTKEELDVQKEIEEYFTESAGFGRDKIRNFMDIVNKALKQKGERIEELEKLIEQMQDAKCISCTDLGGMLLKITDLEKKNTELEQKLEQTEKDLADYQFNYPSIKELSKENAELKTKNKWYSEQVCYKECAEVWGNLTKAKEILQKMLRDIPNRMWYTDETIKQAEQFLKLVGGEENEKR